MKHFKVTALASALSLVAMGATQAQATDLAQGSQLLAGNCCALVDFRW